MGIRSKLSRISESCPPLSELRAVHSQPEKSSGWLVELEATGKGRSTGCTPTTTRSARTTTFPLQATLSRRQRRRITACRVHSASLRGLPPTPSLGSRSLGTLRTHPQRAYELLPPNNRLVFNWTNRK